MYQFIKPNLKFESILSRKCSSGGYCFENTFWRKPKSSREKQTGIEDICPYEPIELPIKTLDKIQFEKAKLDKRKLGYIWARMMFRGEMQCIPSECAGANFCRGLEEFKIKYKSKIKDNSANEANPSNIENIVFEKEKNSISSAVLDLDLVEQLFLHFESKPRGEKQKQYEQIAVTYEKLGRRYVEILIQIWRHYVVIISGGDKLFLEKIWVHGATKLKIIIPIIKSKDDFEKYRNIVNALSTRQLEKEVKRIRQTISNEDI